LIQVPEGRRARLISKDEEYNHTINMNKLVIRLYVVFDVNLT